MRRDSCRRELRRCHRLVLKTFILGSALVLAPFQTGCLGGLLSKVFGGGKTPSAPSTGSFQNVPPGLTTAQVPRAGATNKSTANGNPIGPEAPNPSGGDGLPGSDQTGQTGPGKTSTDGKVREKLDVPYGNQHERQKLDLFLPEKSGPHPVVVFIHGGGFFGGDKSQARGFDGFVKQGFALASVNYTLASKSGGASVLQARQYLVRAIGDVRQAVRYLRSSAGEHGLDGNRIAVFGVSAGGYYAAMLGALSCRNGTEFDRGGGGGSAEVQAVLEYAGPTDFLSYPAGAVGQLARLPGAAQVVGNTLPPSVLPLVGGSHPPTRIIHGRQDRIVPVNQGVQYHQALQRAGVQVEAEFLDGAGHAIPDAMKMQQIQKAVDFVRRHLR